MTIPGNGSNDSNSTKNALFYKSSDRATQSNMYKYVHPQKNIIDAKIRNDIASLEYSNKGYWNFSFL